MSGSKKAVGATVRRLRKQRGWTIQELANEIGSDVGNLSRLERGMQGFSDATLDSLAAALGVPVSVLFITPKQELSVVKEAGATYLPAASLAEDIETATDILSRLPDEARKLALEQLGTVAKMISLTNPKDI